jgi:D-glycero-D-manno-heptose 1,7-bisphosphate phosphatase
MTMDQNKAAHEAQSTRASRRPALFCDLAGTLVKLDENRELPLDSAGNIQIELLAGVADKLKSMDRAVPIYIVTNQSAIVRGRFTYSALQAALTEVNRKLGGIVSGWKVCPHRDGDGCHCRKPLPGMVLALAQEHNLDLAASTMVGDQEVDEQCAKAAGVGSFYYAWKFFARDK